MRTDSPVITLSREKMRCFIQVEKKSDVETEQLQEMESISNSLVEITICVVFATGHSRATESIRSSFISFLKKVIKVMVRRRV